jgi:hypothetical protein
LNLCKTDCRMRYLLYSLFPLVVLWYHDTVWLCRQQLPIIYSWIIGFVQPVVILDLSFKNLWWVVFLFSCISRCWLWAVQYLWCYKFLVNFLSCFIWSLGLIFLSSNRWNTNFSNWTSAAWVYRISGVWLEAAFCSWKEMGPWSSGSFHVKYILILLFLSWIILIHVSVIV